MVEHLYEEGKKLIAALDRHGINIPAALLIESEDYADDWSILLAVENLRETGSKPHYESIHSVIREENIDLNSFDVRVIDSEDLMIKTLRKRIHTAPNSISRIPFVSNYFDGKKFPDAIIYRVA